MEMSSEFDRLLFFEHARKTAEAAYEKNPLDADVCTLFLYILFINEFSKILISFNTDAGSWIFILFSGLLV